MQKPLLKIEHLYKEFEKDEAILKDINLDVYKSDVVSIIGPSGTGKSTLLRCINYLTVPTKGIVSIDDVSVDASSYTKEDVLKLRKHSSMVFQSYNLFKNKTALENVMEALITVHKTCRHDGKKGLLSFQTLRRTATKSRDSKSIGGKSQYNTF